MGSDAHVTSAAQQCMEPWEVWWCYNGWLEPARRLEELLAQRAPWAKLHYMDPKQPLKEQVAGAHVLIPTTGMVTGEDIAAARNLQLVAQPAAGYNNIDVAAAVARGVPVTIAPGYNSQSVAEAALMMMLMLMRRVNEAHGAFQQQVIGEPVGMEAEGKVLGIIGLGKVGQRLAAAAKGLGMQVVGTTSTSTRADLEELLSSSHVVSIHCPVTQFTRNLIGRTELALMRPGALLLNCARGDIIDQEALLEALQSGHLGGAGLDVHWVEPADPQGAVYQHPRVLALPHTGSATDEVYDRFANVLCENIVRCREGRELLHRLA